MESPIETISLGYSDPRGVNVSICGMENILPLQFCLLTPIESNI
jgi:hypothetical protein